MNDMHVAWLLGHYSCMRLRIPSTGQPVSHSQLGQTVS
jgi:hypothetical protein